MSPIVGRPRLRRAVTAVLLVIFAQGCMQWTPAPLEPEGFPAGQDVRVTFHTGEQRTLKSAYIARDSLRSPSAEPIALARILRIERQTTDGAATGAAVATGAVVLAVIAVVALMASFKGMGDLGCFGLACN